MAAMGDTGYVAAVTTHKRGCEDTAKETELYFLLLACTGESIVDFFGCMCMFCACWLTFQTYAQAFNPRWPIISS